jgi:hypothetical protein
VGGDEVEWSEVLIRHFAAVSPQGPRIANTTVMAHMVLLFLKSTVQLGALARKDKDDNLYQIMYSS